MKNKLIELVKSIKFWTILGVIVSLAFGIWQVHIRVIDEQKMEKKLKEDAEKRMSAINIVKEKAEYLLSLSEPQIGNLYSRQTDVRLILEYQKAAKKFAETYLSLYSSDDGERRKLQSYIGSPSWWITLTNETDKMDKLDDDEEDCMEKLKSVINLISDSYPDIAKDVDRLLLQDAKDKYMIKSNKIKDWLIVAKEANARGEYEEVVKLLDRSYDGLDIIESDFAIFRLNIHFYELCNKIIDIIQKPDSSK